MLILKICLSLLLGYFEFRQLPKPTWWLWPSITAGVILLGCLLMIPLYLWHRRVNRMLALKYAMAISAGL